MYMYVATALFLKNTAIKKQILNNGKTQLHHKATLTYTFQEVGTISFMAFSPGKFYRTMNSTIDFNVLLHGFPSLIFRS